MPTYEHRRNSAGEIVAIRVKIRRVGLPHLSRSFKVAGASDAAVRRAEREARTWVGGLAVSLDAMSAEATAALPVAPPLRSAQAAVSAQRAGSAKGRLTAAFSASVAPSRPTVGRAGTEGRITPAHIEALAGVSTPEIAGLICMEVEVGLAASELLALRWQNISLDTYSLAVFGASGAVTRRVPLAPNAIDVLLGMPGRKYGLVFGVHTVVSLDATLARAVRDARLTPALRWPLLVSLRREAALRQLERGIAAEDVARMMGVADLDTILKPRLSPPPTKPRMSR